MALIMQRADAVDGYNGSLLAGMLRWHSLATAAAHLKSRKASTWLRSRCGAPLGRLKPARSTPYMRSLTTGSGARTSASSLVPGGASLRNT